MMELRPIQAALLAGRSASRRATTNPSLLSYPLGPSFYRCFSTTRPSFSEAEATAPAPTPSMTEWNRQQQERLQQQLQQQNQSEQPQRPKGLGTSSGLASLLTPNISTPSPPSSPQPPSASPDTRLRAPWASPSSPALRRAQEKRVTTSDTKPGILDDLKDLFMAPGTEDLWNEVNKLNSEPASDIKYRLRPSVGRTVPIGGQVDLARGLGMLNLRVRVNRVSQDVSRQRFHERPGLKRKRLRRERWRVRFKDGFKATCQRVTDLARQGW